LLLRKKTRGETIDVGDKRGRVTKV